MKDDQPADRSAARKGRRWVWWVVGIVGVLVVLLVVAAPPLLGSFVKGKLVSTVERRTNATLRVGSVTYLPPYGVRVEDASFEVPDPEKGGEVEMVKVKRMELKLARLPLGSGPLVVKSLTIDSPAVRLIQTEQGLLGIEGLVKNRQEAAERVKRRLSEVFELRHLSVTDGSFTYEDRTQPGTAPLVWRGLDVSTETRPKSQGVYAYDLDVRNGKLATLKSSGTADVDNLIVDAQRLALDVRVGQGGKESAVPAQVQRLLARYQVRGDLSVDGHGRVPLRDLNEASYRFDVGLKDGHGAVPKFPRAIDRLTARVRVTGEAKKAISTLVALEAVSGRDVVHVDEGRVAVDMARRAWDLKRLDLRLDARAVGVRPFDDAPAATTTRAAAAQAAPSTGPAGKQTPQEKLRAGGKFELTAAGSGPLDVRSIEDFRRRAKFDVVATATNFHMQPPGFEAPVELVTGSPIVANQDVLRVSNLTGRYGFDQFLLTTLRVPLRDLPRVLRVEQLSASATFDRQSPAYPGKVGEWVKKVRPEGPFELGGTAAYDRGAPKGKKLNYHLLLHSDRGSIEWTDKDMRVPVTQMRLDATADPSQARLDHLEANLFGGLLSVTGSAVPTGELRWQGKGQVRNFDLRTAVQSLTGKQFDTQKLAGQASVRFDMSGGKTPRSIAGKGDARLVNGRLFEVPVLADVLGRAGFGRGLVANEAAATFDVRDAKVNVRQSAVGSSLVGVAGHGTVGFDKSLNLDVVVAPLGQWKDRIKKTGVPIVSRALGEVAGVVQGVVNTAASTLLYEFHVGGTADAPKIVPVPAPILTKGAASIFGTMLGAGKKGTSLEEQVQQNAAEDGAASAVPGGK